MKTVLAWLLCTTLAVAWPADHYRQWRAAHSVRHDLPLPSLRTAGRGAVGQVVEWRGMVDTVSWHGGHLSFSLRMGQDAAEVLVHDGSFQLAAGSAVGVLGRVTAVGRHPVLDLVAAAPAAEVGLGDEAPRHVGSWARWMLGFNPSLSASTAQSWLDAIVHVSDRYGVDPRLVLAVVAAESAFQPDAVSPVGAAGLGQLMPDTATRLGVRNRYDPLDNLQGAVRLLGQHLQHYGRLPLVLASYNAGEGAVAAYGGVPPYAETQNYVRYVLSLYKELGGAGGE